MTEAGDQGCGIKGRPRARSRVRLLAVLACCCGVAACSDQPKTETDQATPIAREQLPAFSAIAAVNNKRVDAISRIWARATVQVRYTDDDGERRFEQGEGHLRMETPDLVALSAGKVGQTLFWLGCDRERYWWFDLTGDVRRASVGRHNGPGKGRGGLASSVNPHDLPRLMGLSPLGRNGVVESSRDGKLVSVTTTIDPAGTPIAGFERRWIDPRTFEPAKIEIWDAARKPVLVADLAEYQNLELEEGGGGGPRVPTQVFIGHSQTATVVRLYLSAASDGTRNWEPQAFEFDRLIGVLSTNQVTDLDAKPTDGPKKSY